MRNYRVRWEIDVEADSEVEAAAIALITQRDNDPANSATVFQVCDHTNLSPGKEVSFGATVDLSTCGEI